MTEALRLIGLALLGAAMSALLRAFCRREAALLCEIACGLVLLLRALRLCGAVAFPPRPRLNFRVFPQKRNKNQIFFLCAASV